MSDVYPKYIIETDPDYGDCLIIGQVEFHKHLAVDKTKVKGGGWWKREENHFIFRDCSHDFGQASLEDVKACIENDNVYTNNTCVNSIAKEFKFSYDTGCELIPLN